ncbi:MAG TPA: hypothetical protein VNN10_06860 [Dehalococcoidia bacterium]|nr:hypothetical protein [Dehalococcoidia bacterium]
MRPDGDELPGIIRRALVEYVAPEVSSVYGRTQLTYALSLLAQLAREADGAAARLDQEISALRRVLGAALRRLEAADEDPRLVSDARAALRLRRKRDLRLSALRAERAALLEVLVRLEAACSGAARGTARARVHGLLVSFLRAQSGGRAPAR